MNEEIQKEIFREQTKKTVKKTIKRILKGILIFIVCSTIFFTYTTYVSTTKIGVREYRITNKKIPESFKGLKIIQISDLHYGTTMLLEDLKIIKKLSNERRPDLVVFTGDLLSKKINIKEQEKIINELKGITSTLGKYAILGDEDTEIVTTIFNQSEFTILKNEYDLIYQDNTSPILLVGLSSSLNKELNLENAYHYFQEKQHNADIFTITLLHEPDSVDNIIDYYPTDLFLAGHSHNGNIRIPFINQSFIKQKGAKKYDAEHYSLKDKELYISSGLGTKKGIRLFCRPSINFFRLAPN